MARAKGAAAAAKKEAAPKAEKDSQNGVTRPKDGTATGAVWKICDQISSRKKRPAERAEVIEKAEADGINKATASTQYGRWCRYHGVDKSKKD